MYIHALHNEFCLNVQDFWRKNIKYAGPTEIVQDRNLQNSKI